MVAHPLARLRHAGNHGNMYKHARKIAVWVLCGQMLCGCAAEWRPTFLGTHAPDRPLETDRLSGSLAVALEERGLSTTVIPAPDTPPKRRPAVATPPTLATSAPTLPPTASAPARVLPAVPAAQPRPTQHRRIVSIPLSVADDAHAQGLLRRAALLNSSYGGRISLAPYGPDPAEAEQIARIAATQLRTYGVPDAQLMVQKGILTNIREARIDVLFEY